MKIDQFPKGNQKTSIWKSINFHKEIHVKIRKICEKEELSDRKINLCFTFFFKNYNNLYFTSNPQPIGFSGILLAKR
uniref:hypothetical protein n=1 Tax=Phocaeicola coprophilus TaxID=387090 RepID=UPI003079656F